VGLLCCIFESYEKKELPLYIMPQNVEQLTLLQSRMIDTNLEKADRVKAGIRKRASQDVFDMVEFGFYTCHPQKERLILHFVRLGMQYGKKALHMLTDDTVDALQKAVNALLRESQHLTGFVRFSLYNGILVAGIEPKNYVLPLLAPHFCDRYANETFMIYDMTHADALLYQGGQSAILPVFGFSLPEADEDELRFRSLWKLFYDTIAIEERFNPKCRMTLMPKRHWKHLTEMDEYVEPASPIGKPQDLARMELKQLR